METLKINYNKNNVNDAIKSANKHRLNNKNAWYQLHFINEENKQDAKLKCFNTWIQLASKPVFSNVIDSSIKEFKENLKNGLNRL